MAPELSSLLDGDSGDVVLVDARHDLVQARTLCGLLSSTGVAASLVAVLSEGGLVALSADWGVDDVLLDTAGPAEVDARLKWATARRLAASTPADGNDGGVTQAGELVIDEHSYSAKLSGRPLDLTYKEFELLKYLAQHPGRVFPRAAAAGDLGLRPLRRHPHGRRPRAASARQAGHRARGADRHCAQRRLQARPAGRRRSHKAAATKDAAAAAEDRPTPNWSDDRVNDDLDVADVLALLRAATAADGVRLLSEERAPAPARRPGGGATSWSGTATGSPGTRATTPAPTAASRPSWSCIRPSGGAARPRAARPAPCRGVRSPPAEPGRTPAWVG